MTIPYDAFQSEEAIAKIVRQIERENVLSKIPDAQFDISDIRKFLESQKQIHEGIGKDPFKCYATRSRIGDHIEPFMPPDAGLFEAVILTALRPAILVQNNTFTIDDEDYWFESLESARSNIENVVRSVGRIEVLNHPNGYVYVGTGWLVAPDVIITNRHIAQNIAYQSGNEFRFIKNPRSNQTIGVNIDFCEEYKVDHRTEFQILEVLYVEEEDSLDVALLKISTKALLNGEVVDLNASPIVLTEAEIEDNAEIAVIGYPAEDSRRNPLSDREMKDIFGDIYNVKRLQPGSITSVEPNLITHDASTLGGNSGSVLIDLKTGKAVGLHYGGYFLEENYAVSAPAIQKIVSKLRIGSN